MSSSRMPGSTVRAAAGLQMLERETLALVLAGGNGTRLGALTRFDCKPALPFAGRYRTIDFSLSNCVHSGIRRIAVLTQYKAQTLIGHIEQAWGFLPRQLGEFVDLWPAQQRSGAEWYRGTADALHQNVDLIRALNPRLVLVLAGDHVYRMDYRAMLAQHVASGADVTVASVPVARAEARAFGIPVVQSDGRIGQFIEKPAPEELPTDADFPRASMGVYVFSLDYLCDRLAHDARDVSSAHDIGRNILPAAVACDRVYAYDFVDASTGRAGFWRDVGTLDSYWLTHMEMLDPAITSHLLDPGRPIFTHQRALSPTVLTARSNATFQEALVCEGCVLESAHIRHSVLGPGVHVGAGSRLEHCVVLPGASIGRNCHVQRAIIESGCRVPDGTLIGSDTASDKSRYELSAGGIALVTRDAFTAAITPPGLYQVAQKAPTLVHVHERSAYTRYSAR